MAEENDEQLHHKTFTALTTCKHCGNGLPLQGPLRTVRCTACEGENHFKPGDVASTVMSAKRRREPPSCSCGAPIDLSIPLDLDGETSCPGCGAPIPVFPPPAWLQEELPALRQIIAAEREGVTSLPAKAGPVALNCPSCNAGLQLDGETKRTTVCSFCGASVALPDDIWRALHPVPRARSWTIVWQGQLEYRSTINKRELNERIEARRAEKKAAKQQRERARADARAERVMAEWHRERRSRIAIVFVFVVVTLLGIGFWLWGR